MSILMRLPDWKPRLSAWLSTIARTPFAWGTHDCALFAAGTVQAMTDHDPAAAWRGRYSSLKGGLRLIRAVGHRDHIAMARSMFVPCHRAFAVAGDLAVLPDEGEGEVLGLVQGQVIYVLSPGGLATVPMAKAAEFLVVGRWQP